MTLSSEGSGLSINRAMRMMQFSDSMFPVGSFSFSNGLESAVAQGIVTDGPSLREFVLSAAHQGATCDGIAVLAAHRGATAGDFSAILAADHAVIERKLNEEARTMSTRMGKKLAELGGRLAGETLFNKWLAAIASGETPGTYPVGLGIAFAEMGSPEEDAFTVNQYGVAMTLLGAALRIVRVDHLATQEILFEVNQSAGREYAAVRDYGLDDMSNFAPMIDILAAVHVKAHVRMFMN
ncbi:urease accessory protein UreF [Rhodococcus erythropolis]|jgi:urease accessory protein|uniref:Urease accessory protein UreF n=1 Tax=Rhodococcus erythropolis TaxID=1833 RepID=A0A6G9CKK4_RHOER|nr:MULTISPECIES: urease accessory protein UreF [Rhodococcus]NHP16291.1 urease accessory protein UreF [Rhodococcus sp. IC4_135]ATI35394.1 urease accessory protein UreF [Rhodococcus sp. H-CA8f]MBJ7477502.1 urease accessory protein UreF [Rhodococcus sp. (in: high G+C Gram-positive bacteria)]MCJ0899396.1 urease accessory protein UreF [Rhodococcus sp. ARC_M13]QIP37555.1 urease accessory protein UreF [Rhodococcus erythropolis]